MSSPSSTPRGKHTPAPGVTWQTFPARVEQLADAQLAAIIGTVAAVLTWLGLATLLITDD